MLMTELASFIEVEKIGKQMAVDELLVIPSSIRWKVD